MRTKEKIIDAAIKLFNKYGTEKITTRHIAAEIGISQGNLHYHYPNKDKVIIAIFIQFVSEMDENASDLVNNPIPSVDSLYKSIRHDFNLLLKFKFLFQDQMVIWRRIPEIERQFKKMFERRRWEFENLVLILTKNGILRKDIPLNQFEALFYQNSILTTSWLQNIDLFGSFKTVESLVNYISDKLFRIWWPYFTSKGIMEFDRAVGLSEEVR